MTRERLGVTLTTEHLRGMRRSATTGLLELVKNSLDSGASRVDITFGSGSPLGGLDEVVVEDDGEGMTPNDVQRHFRPLSRSWKRGAARAAGDRDLFGTKGEGRLTAFGIGDHVTWDTTAQVDDNLVAQRLEWSMTEASTEAEAFWREDVAVPTEAHTGTRVTIRALRPKAQALNSEAVRDTVEVRLSEFLEKHAAQTTVTIDGHTLDPTRAQRHRTTIDIAVPENVLAACQSDPESPEPAACSTTAQLVVIEWDHPVSTKSALWLAQTAGTPLASIPARHAAPGISFTAWLLWDGWSKFQHLLPVVEMSPAADLVADARAALEHHLRVRSHARGPELLEQWKEEGSYPFTTEPSTSAAVAERQLFDIVAVTAAPALEKSDTSGRKFALALLIEALRSDQTALGNILRSVLDLDEETQEKMATLLDRAPLRTIVEISHLVLSRATFLDWLEHLLFDDAWSAALGEKPGLHDLLSPNTWVFGDRWSVMVDEGGLSEVARQHEALLGQDTTDGDAVIDSEGKRRRIDLMLNRAKRDSGHHEYLVVELKRPSRTINAHDLEQVENYLQTLGNHRRFANGTLTWTFVLVGTDCTPGVHRRRKQADREVGLVDVGSFTSGARYELWVRTWAEILADARDRLDFVRDAIESAPANDDRFDLLQRMYKDVLPELEEPAATTSL